MKNIRINRNQNADRIKDARSENRKEFLTIKTTDPRAKLQEIPIEQAKERRQKIFEENRSKKKEHSKEEQNNTQETSRSKN